MKKLLSIVFCFFLIGLFSPIFATENLPKPEEALPQKLVTCDAPFRLNAGLMNAIWHASPEIVKILIAKIGVGTELKSALLEAVINGLEESELIKLFEIIQLLTEEGSPINEELLTSMIATTTPSAILEYLQSQQKTCQFSTSMP